MELSAYRVFFLFCGVIFGGSSIAAQNETTSASSESATTASAASVTSSYASTQFTSVPTSAPPQCQDARWLVSFQDGKRFCIIMQAVISVTVIENNKTTNIDIPQNATSSGSCSEHTDTEVLNITDGDLLLEWTFVRSDDKFNVTRIAITYNKNITANIDLDGSWLSNLVKTNLYQCDAEKTVNGTAGTSSFIMTMRQLRLEAFYNTTSPCTFDGKRDVCQDDLTVSNLVPIIVGACLVGLIVIVLIAYLVGRRRSRRGYESV